MQRAPALAIGLMMALYWARVMRLAWKQKRKSGRAANLFPPEPLGRTLRIIWFPTIALWIALPLLYATRSPGRPRFLTPLFQFPLLSWIALATALAAFIATWICWEKMGRSWRMGINPDDKTRLIVTGPYARIRHPIYALSSLLMICTMLILPSPAMLTVGLVHLSLLQWEARREERYLTALHGPTYTEYAARTGRFLPRF